MKILGLQCSAFFFFLQLVGKKIIMPNSNTYCAIVMNKFNDGVHSVMFYKYSCFTYFTYMSEFTHTVLTVLLDEIKIQSS